MRGPDSVARNTSFALAVKLTGALFTAILTVVLVRVLGPREYGLFALALSVGGLVILPSNLGISQSAARFVAERRGDPDGVLDVVTDALRLKLAIAGSVSIALAIAAGPIADAYGAPGLEWPIRVLAIAVFGQSVLMLFDALFESLGRLSVFLRVVALESATETGASILLVVGGLGAVGAVVGRSVAYAVAAVFGFVLIARTLGRTPRPSPRRGHGHVRALTGYGAALLVIEGTFTLFSRIDVLLIGGYLGVRSVALFEAPFRLTTFLGYAGAAASAGVAPRVARGPEGPDRVALERALRWLILVQAAVVAPVVVWAEPLIELVLGGEYAESAEVLRALAPFVFLLGVSPILASSVNYLGEARKRVPVAIVALAINTVIDILLIPEIGIVAGALGTAVAYTFYVGAHVVLCRRLIGLELRGLALTTVRAFLAATGMAGVLLLFGSSDVAVPLLAAGAVLGSAAYLAVLLALREVRAAELAALLAAARRLRARR